MTPVVCCYKAENVDMVHAAHSAAFTGLGYAEMFIEVKPDPAHDFFVDQHTDPLNHDFLASSPDEDFSEQRDRALGQHISYVIELFARQHRVFTFTISMSGSQARFLRWDRAGCVVSTSFDIRERPELLCDFLWRFSQTSDAGRGHDPTVIRATPAQEDRFRERLRTYLLGQLDVDDATLDRAVAEHYQPGHASILHVLTRSQLNMPAETHLRRFIVSRPMVTPLYLTGRATRGFWAVDESNDQLVFLKDTWRISSAVEGETIQHLHESGVRNIPTLVCHGDVPTYIPVPVDDLVSLVSYAVVCPAVVWIIVMHPVSMIRDLLPGFRRLAVQCLRSR